MVSTKDLHCIYDFLQRSFTAHSDDNICKLIVIVKCSTKFQRAFKLCLKKQRVIYKMFSQPYLEKTPPELTPKVHMCVWACSHTSVKVFS